MTTRFALSSLALRRALVIASSAAALSLATGCDKGSSGPAPANSATTTPEVKADVKGLEAPGNNPVLVEQAKKALGCKWTTLGFDAKCDDLRALLDNEAAKDSKGDATFVSFLEDSNEQVRWLGSRALAQRGKAFRTDKQLAERIVKAAEAEKSKGAAQEMGLAVGSIKHAETGLGDRIKKIATEHELLYMRTSILGRMLFSNGELLYDFVKNIATSDKDTAVRKAAMSAFWTGTPPTRVADTCKMWLGFMDDPADDVAGEAAYLTAFYPQHGGCKSEWDAVLDKVEAHAKAGTIKSTQMAAAMTYLHRQAGASAAQKKRAVAVARLIVENTKNLAMARGRAMEFVADNDPDAKKLLEKLQDDSDTFVKTRAKDLAQRPPKKDADKAQGDTKKAAPATKAAVEPNKK